MSGAWTAGPVTRLVALLGFPVGHSGSPAMHNAAFRRAGIDAVYVACAVPPADLPAAVAGLRALGALGANVTVPHKEAALTLADDATAAARRCGAVNVLAFRGRRVMADNTDAPGFAAALRASGIAVGGRRVALLGAGGAARAVALALLEAGAAAVEVVARDPARAAGLCEGLASVEPRWAGRLRPLAWGDREGASLPGAVDMVVNCTPLGLRRDDPCPLASWDALAPGAVAVDLIYNPSPTEFLRRAAAAGFTALDGSGMLVWQAALSWRLWFDREGPVDVMRAALADWLASAASGEASR